MSNNVFSAMTIIDPQTGKCTNEDFLTWFTKDEGIFQSVCVIVECAELCVELR